MSHPVYSRSPLTARRESQYEGSSARLDAPIFGYFWGRLDSVYLFVWKAVAYGIAIAQPPRIAGSLRSRKVNVNLCSSPIILGEYARATATAIPKISKANTGP